MIVSSPELEMQVLPSEVRAKLVSPHSCPTKEPVHWDVARSQILQTKGDAL